MLVYIRGAGDLASGIALRLYHAGMDIVMSDLPIPTAIRRTVCFSEAIRLGKASVEEIEAERALSEEKAKGIVLQGKIAVIADSDGNCARRMHPDAEVDAILAKKNLGTRITDAPVVVGVGPGFTAGLDCHAVVETMRGHTLGRVLYYGSAIPNTGIPGNIGGFTEERVLRASAAGKFHCLCTIGDLVEKGAAVADVGGFPIAAQLNGMVRGLLPDGIYVRKGMKCGDVDPRGRQAQYMTVSDKALAVGGGVLEAILHFSAGIKKGGSII